MTDPIRPHFVNEAIPTTYSEVWGDYFGVWRGSRERQSILGLLPTVLAIAGWLVLLVRSRRLPAAAAGRAAAGPWAPRLPLLHVSYPTPDGDVLKASYMLTTAPAWALAFGYAVDRLPGRWRARGGRDPGRLGARKPPVPAVLTAVTAVLFTCAGQRVDIVGAFKRAGATAIAADANPLAPALYEADAHALVPRIDDPDYLPALRALVAANTTCG